MYFCDMIQLDKKIISLDIFKKYFSCDLKSCKGACCIEGDSGAPLEKNEKIIIEENYQDIRPYMQKKGIEAIVIFNKAVDYKDFISYLKKL